MADEMTFEADGGSEIEPSIVTAAESAAHGDDASPASIEEPGQLNERGEDSQFHQLDPNYIRAEKVGWWISEAVIDTPLVVFIGLMWIFAWFPDLVRLFVTLGGATLILLLRFLAMSSMWWVYNTTSYSVSPLGMVIRRGIFWKREEHIPKSRIQHTDVTQGPVQRKFGIGTLVLHTAGTHNASITLGGLNYERACRIRDDLIVGGDHDAV